MTAMHCFEADRSRRGYPIITDRRAFRTVANAELSITFSPSFLIAEWLVNNIYSGISPSTEQLKLIVSREKRRPGTCLSPRRSPEARTPSFPVLVTGATLAFNHHLRRFFCAPKRRFVYWRASSRVGPGWIIKIITSTSRDVAVRLLTNCAFFGVVA